MLLNCKQCKHNWIQRIVGRPPKVCPSCQSSGWDDAAYVRSQKKVFICLRCPPTGRMIAGEPELAWWLSRQERPKVCPHCHSPYWDRPRGRGLVSPGLVSPAPPPPQTSLPPASTPYRASDGTMYQDILICADCQATWKIREDHKIRPCPRCKSERVERDRIPADKITP